MVFDLNLIRAKNRLDDDVTNMAVKVPVHEYVRKIIPYLEQRQKAALRLREYELMFPKDKSTIIALRKSLKEANDAVKLMLDISPYEEIITTNPEV
jgi:hypothetical protein